MIRVPACTNVWNDTVIAGFEGVRTGMALAADKSVYDHAPISRGADVAFGLGFLALFGASAIYGTDAIAFTFVSDELNGVTRDNDGNVRPMTPRSFASLSQAEEENGQSRIYLGIHWVFDKTESIALGRSVGDFVFDHTFVPLHPPRR